MKMRRNKQISSGIYAIALQNNWSNSHRPVRNSQFVYRFILLSYICVDLHDIAWQIALSLNSIVSIFVVNFCHIEFARQTDEFRKY